MHQPTSKHHEPISETKEKDRHPQMRVQHASQYST
jgi:hypothetical protein